MPKRRDNPVGYGSLGQFWPNGCLRGSEKTIGGSVAGGIDRRKADEDDFGPLSAFGLSA